jgi:hypothetical protein
MARRTKGSGAAPNANEPPRIDATARWNSGFGDQPQALPVQARSNVPETVAVATTV